MWVSRVTCHMSRVTCQMSLTKWWSLSCHKSHVSVMCHKSRATCHMSRVTCQMFFFVFLLFKVVKLIGGGSVINGAYPFYFFYNGNINFFKVNKPGGLWQSGKYFFVKTQLEAFFCKDTLWGIFLWRHNLRHFSLFRYILGSI